mmetsp:Transcript_4425/g.12548  ORF Transcript_4425/g.12548 Transcript_4425/m.12548 type:complete len:82 (+) Transcript_4425:151-396(+)
MPGEETSDGGDGGDGGDAGRCRQAPYTSLVWTSASGKRQPSASVARIGLANSRGMASLRISLRLSPYFGGSSSGMSDTPYF